jgi:transcription initiation factor IIF auxiliary subunit
MRSQTVPHVFLPTLAWVLAILFSSSALAQEISTFNTSRPLGPGQWEWTVYINASWQVLNQIECVEYTLHRTFPRPVQTICDIGDRRRPFRLTANGWGEFTIRIRVFMTDNKYVELSHRLELQ